MGCAAESPTHITFWVCRFFKTQSGVKIQELAMGSGLEAKSGDSVEFEYVLRCALLTHRRQT